MISNFGSSKRYKFLYVHTYDRGPRTNSTEADTCESRSIGPLRSDLDRRSSRVATDQSLVTTQAVTPARPKAKSQPTQPPTSGPGRRLCAGSDWGPVREPRGASCAAEPQNPTPPPVGTGQTRPGSGCAGIKPTQIQNSNLNSKK